MKKTFTSIDQLPITLSAEDIARALGISRTGAYQLLHTKGFPVMRVGKLMMTPKDKFTAWMDRQTMPIGEEEGRAI